MAARLGYGGLANTNGARSFAGKEEAEPVVLSGSRARRIRRRHYRIILFLLGL